MRQDQVSFGILGTSYISEVMADAVHQSNTSCLKAIASRNSDSAADFAARFSIEHAYSSYQSLLDDREIDVVYIGLPNHLHKEWILKAAAAGKHILCEKPLVLNVSEAHDVMKAVEKAGVFCMEGLMYRHHPFTKKLHEVIQQGTIGDVRLYQAAYTANICEIANPVAGGCIRNLGCYPASVVRLLAGCEPTSLQALGRRNIATGHDHQATAMIGFESGAIAVVSVADDLEMIWQFDIFGTKGHIQVVTNPWLPDKEENQLVIHLNSDQSQTDINVTADKDLYVYQIDAVSLAVKNKSWEALSSVSLADSLANTALLEKWGKLIQQESVNHACEKAG